MRVWDAETKWQWPNLPYLLRYHGEERVERYGGIDPGKLVDNDFAAVLIRKFDADGHEESPASLNMPLVSAEWNGEMGTETDIHTVVHTATSETFIVDVGGSDEHSRGMLKLWLIYADFLGSRPPSSWPKEPEWAGGILAYCEIGWEKLPRDSCRGTVRFKAPPTATGFDWKEWCNDVDSPGKSRLKEEVPK
ncbi:hypothetical protein [Stieleria varia]|uniref:hypothetical protein n=1 Tax=Stieleria varia TaxID=2528005 RepID=UPI0011B36C32|nr:hypothetical protein [Stieleria varia]